MVLPGVQATASQGCRIAASASPCLPTVLGLRRTTRYARKMSYTRGMYRLPSVAAMMALMVRTVLGLLELAAVIGVEHLVGDFHLLDAGARPCRRRIRLRVVEGRQAVQEDVVGVLHVGQQLGVHLVGRHELHALGELGFLAHGGHTFV